MHTLVLFLSEVLFRSKLIKAILRNRTGPNSLPQGSPVAFHLRMAGRAMRWGSDGRSPNHLLASSVRTPPILLSGAVVREKLFG